MPIFQPTFVKSLNERPNEDTPDCLEQCLGLWGYCILQSALGSDHLMINRSPSSQIIIILSKLHMRAQDINKQPPCESYPCQRFYLCSLLLQSSSLFKDGSFPRYLNRTYIRRFSISFTVPLKIYGSDSSTLHSFLTYFVNPKSSLTFIVANEFSRIRRVSYTCIARFAYTLITPQQNLQAERKTIFCYIAIQIAKFWNNLKVYDLRKMLLRYGYSYALCSFKRHKKSRYRRGKREVFHIKFVYSNTLHNAYTKLQADYRDKFSHPLVKTLDHRLYVATGLYFVLHRHSPNY